MVCFVVRTMLAISVEYCDFDLSIVAYSYPSPKLFLFRVPYSIALLPAMLPQTAFPSLYAFSTPEVYSCNPLLRRMPLRFGASLWIRLGGGGMMRKAVLEYSDGR